MSVKEFKLWYIVLSVSYCFTILLKKNVKIVNILVITIFHIYVLVTYVFHVWLHLILTKQSRDIEQNPRPKSNFCKIKFICHWNLNCISAHNFIKISFLNINIMLIRNYLDSSISNDDENVEILSNKLFRAVHPSNN